MMKQIFGHPKEEGIFVKELYCGMCQKIPTFDTFDRSTGKIVGVQIGELCPLSTMRPGENGVVEEMLLMICEGCMVRVDKRFKEEIAKLYRRPPPGSEPEGGSPIPK